MQHLIVTLEVTIPENATAITTANFVTRVVKSGAKKFPFIVRQKDCDVECRLDPNSVKLRSHTKLQKVKRA